eukprot:6176401-Pleurochrysis_carterae.AAC.1
MAERRVEARIRGVGYKCNLHRIGSRLYLRLGGDERSFEVQRAVGIVVRHLLVPAQRRGGRQRGQAYERLQTNGEDEGDGRRVRTLCRPARARRRASARRGHARRSRQPAQGKERAVIVCM